MSQSSLYITECVSCGHREDSDRIDVYCAACGKVSCRTIPRERPPRAGDPKPGELWCSNHGPDFVWIVEIKGGSVRYQGRWCTGDEYITMLLSAFLGNFYFSRRTLTKDEWRREQRG